MLGNASPRNPRDFTWMRSSALRILLVACRNMAMRTSASDMPEPSSLTRILPTPPASISTSMRFAPASRAFSTSSLTTEETQREPRLKALAQYARCYILASDSDGLYIVDQHAAHERLLFDLLSQKQAPSTFQTLLIPLVVDLDPVEAQVAESYSSELASLGFAFDWMGPGTVRISELPNHIPSQEAEGLFHQFLSSAMALKTPEMETFRQLWIETAACHMAVRAGQTLNLPQMQGLLDDLMKAPRPYSCPHGRPTLIRLTEKDLAKLFKRI